MIRWTILPVADFGAHAAQWQALNDAASGTPLLSLDFVEPLLNEFKKGDEKLAIASVDGVVKAMTVLALSRTSSWETFQRSQSPLGLWVSHPDLPIDAALDSLLRALPGFALTLSVTQADPWLTPRPAHTSTLDTLDYIETARIRLSGTYDDFWAARGKNLRANLKKQRPRLLKEGITTRLETLRKPEQMAAALDLYGTLESAGWKASGGTAIHADNEQGRFYRAMLERFCQRDAACVQCYWFNDKVVAIDLCIEGGGQTIILKTTYDETVPGYFSPTFLMREETVRQLFDEQRFSTLEFYGKAMEWHRKWSDDIRTMYHVNDYRWPFVQKLHFAPRNNYVSATSQSHPGRRPQPGRGRRFPDRRVAPAGQHPRTRFDGSGQSHHRAGRPVRHHRRRR
jgi:CelD/BcsL family acetyltransferase involved in cellulose biosynthesis